MIYDDGLRLRAPEREDIPNFVAWMNDPEVRQGLHLKFPISIAEEEQWFEDMLKRPQAEHPMVIEIQDGDDWVAIGNCGIHDIDWRNRSAEVGIFIGEKAHWDQGHGTRVMSLVLRHGFKTLNLNRIYLRVFANNPRAIRAYEKAGFVLEGNLRQAEYQDGQYVDALIMSVLRQEWSEQESE